jgi:hypothetical protein
VARKQATNPWWAGLKPLDYIPVGPENYKMFMEVMKAEWERAKRPTLTIGGHEVELKSSFQNEPRRKA